MTFKNKYIWFGFKDICFNFYSFHWYTRIRIFVNEIDDKWQRIVTRFSKLKNNYDLLSALCIFSWPEKTGGVRPCENSVTARPVQENSLETAGKPQVLLWSTQSLSIARISTSSELDKSAIEMLYNEQFSQCQSAKIDTQASQHTHRSSLHVAFVLRNISIDHFILRWWIAFSQNFQTETDNKTLIKETDVLLDEIVKECRARFILRMQCLMLVDYFF